MAYRCPIDPETFRKYESQTKKAMESLELILANFEAIKEWSEIEKWIRRIKRVVKEFHTPFIPNRALLFRRLSQCLSLSFPDGIHKHVFEIYTQILENMQTSPENCLNDMFYITQGLFPHYRGCSVQMKPPIFDIFEKYILNMGETTGMMVPALIETLAPPLTQNNEAVQKRTFAFFDRIGKIFPEAFLFCTLWMVLLRSPKSRYGLLKYMTAYLVRQEKIQQGEIVDDTINEISPDEHLEEDEEELEEEDEEEKELRVSDSVQEPQQKLIEPPKTKVATKKDYLDEEDERDPEFDLMKQKEELGEVLENENEHEDENAEQDENNKSQTKSDHKHLESPKRHEEEEVEYEEVEEGEEGEEEAEEGSQEADQVTPKAEEVDQKEKVNAGEHLQAIEDELIRDHAAEQHINRVIDKKILEAELTSNSKKEIPLSKDLEIDNKNSIHKDSYAIFLEECHKKRKEWIEYIKSECKQVIFPNKTVVINAIRRCLEDPDNLIKKKMLDFLINYIPLEHQDFNEVEKIAITQAVIFALENQDSSVRGKCIVYLFGALNDEGEPNIVPEEQMQTIFKAFADLLMKPSKFETIFKVLQNIYTSREDLIEPFIIGLNLEIVEAMGVALNTVQSKEQEQKSKSICERFLSSTSSYFRLFLEKYIDHPAEKLNAIGLNMFWTTMEKRDIEDRWSSSKGKSFFELLLEGFLKTATALDPSKASSKIVFNRLYSLIQKYPNLSLTEVLKELGESFLTNFETFLESETRNFDMEIFEFGFGISTWILRKLGDQKAFEAWMMRLERFLEESSRRAGFTTVAVKGVLSFLSGSDDSIVSKEIIRNVLRIAIQRSWQLLDDISSHTSAINLITELFEAHPNEMKFQIKAMLAQEEVRMREASLQRLVVFWKLTGFKTKNSLKISRLEDIVDFELLEYLENEHPVLRQIAKSWLIDSSEWYQRIMDPLLYNLIEQCSLFTTVSKRVFHTKEYDVKLVFDIFRKTKHLISNNVTQYAKFVLESRLSDTLIVQGYNLLVEEKSETNHYHQLWLNILLKYLQGMVLPFMGMRFSQDNLLVNTAACELLELHIKTVLSVDPGYLKEDLVETLIRCYYLFVKDENAVMQAHTLNLLKVILFQSGFLEKKQKNLQFFEKIFVEMNLLTNVLESIKFNPNNYTLLKIVDFLQTTVQLFATNFPEQKLKEIIMQIFNAYSDFVTTAKPAVSGIDSSLVLVNAMTKLVSHYCMLDSFVPPKRRLKESSTFFSVMTFGMFSGSKKQVNQFKQVEAFFVDNFKKFLTSFIKGWKCTENAEETYEIYNIGGTGQSEEFKLPEFETRSEEFSEFVEKMYYKYPKDFFDAFLNLFADLFDKDRVELKRSTYLARMVDIILSLEIPSDELFQRIQECPSIKSNRERKKKNNSLITWEQSKFEIAASALYYYVIKYKITKFIPKTEERKQFLREVWFNIMNFNTFIGETNHVMQLCWAIDLYYLMSVKQPVAEVIEERSIRSKLHIHENDILEQIVGFICDEDKQKQSFEKPPGDRGYSFLFPFPAEIVNIALNEKEIYMPRFFQTYPEEIYLRYFYKILALKFLKKITNKLFKGTYGANKLDRVSTRVYNLLYKLFAFMETLLANKSDMNSLLYEEIIEYVYIFLEEGRNFLMDNLKKMIQNFFDSDLFFECPPKALNMWSKIINWHVLFSKEVILDTYMSNINFSSLFSSKTTAAKVRFKSFQRLCFILYSGEKDKFLTQKRLKILLEAIRDALRQSTLSGAILVVLFFCLRILITKTTTNTSIDLFSIIWPIVLSLLIAIFNNEMLSEDINVKLASIKLLECISMCNADQLYLHFFSLGFDHVNYNFEEVPAEKINDSFVNFTSQFPFIPFLTKLIRKNYTVTHHIIQNNVTDETELDIPPRQPIFKMNKVENELEFSQMILDFMQQMIKMNSKYCNVDQDSISELIMNDFITLNEFLSNIN